MKLVVVQVPSLQFYLASVRNPTSLGRLYIRCCRPRCDYGCAGIGFPGYLPVSSGVGPSAEQWRPPVMPASSEGPPASEAGPALQPFPWLGAPFPGPGDALVSHSCSKAMCHGHLAPKEACLEAFTFESCFLYHWVSAAEGGSHVHCAMLQGFSRAWQCLGMCLGHSQPAEQRGARPPVTAGSGA